VDVREEIGAVRQPEPVESMEPDPEAHDVDEAPETGTEPIWIDEEPEPEPNPPVAEEAPVVSEAATGQTVVVV
jgi:hypothetical protein